MTMKIVLNGEGAEVDKDTSLSKLIEAYRLRPERIAVEVNRQIVSRDKFASLSLHEGDEIEIVHMVGGG